MRTFDIWYMKPGFFPYGVRGFVSVRANGMVPDPNRLQDTHIFLTKVNAENVEDAFVKMQGENWSPNGQAQDLIIGKGLMHTSMAVGDIIVDDNGVVFFVDNVGFEPLAVVAEDVA